MLKGELKKIFSKKLNWIMISVAGLLAIVFSCFAIGSMRYVDEAGVTHTGVTAARRLAADKNRWEGDLTEDKIEIVNSYKKMEKKYSGDVPDTEYGKTLQSYNDIIDFIISVFVPDSEYDESILYRLTEKQLRDLYAEYKNNIDKMIDEYGKTTEQKQFLKIRYEKIKMPIYYQAKDSWDTMAMYVETYGIILAVIIGFLASGIFAEEFQTGAEAVFLSTKYGRSKAVKNKIAAGMLLTTIVYWGGMSILTLISFGIMGVSGFNTPYQVFQPYAIYSMTYGGYYFIMLLCGYIASLLAASITMLVTVKMHTRNVAVVIPFFLYCMMPFIGRALSSFVTFFDFMPNVLLNIMEFAKNPVVYQIGNTVFRQVPMVMLIYAIVSVLLLPFAYRCFCRYGLKK